MLGKIIRQAEEELKIRQAELKAMMPHFDTKEEALKYAVCIANLQPGDRVKAPPGKALADCVFLRLLKDEAVLLVYDEDKKTLFTNCVAPSQIVLD